ncbi:MAG: lysophospholipid acyltransferase family protein [Chloroflexota bacterium]
MLLYMLARVVSFLLRRLPQRFLYVMAVVLGEALYLAWPRARRTAQENMRLVLGPEATRRAVNRAARRAFRNLVRYCAEFVCSHKGCEERVSFTGLEHLDMALADGKGAIVVGLHMGSWDLAGMSVARRRYRLNVVVDKFCNDQVNRWVQRMRSQVGMKVVSVKEGMPALFRALRRNELLALLIDCPALGNVKVRFCGAMAKVPGGAAALALRTGAKIVPGTVVRTPGNRFMTFFDKPLHFEPSGDFSRDVEALTQHIMEALEKTVRQYPDQWFMFRRIWV